MKIYITIHSHAKVIVGGCIQMLLWNWGREIINFQKFQQINEKNTLIHLLQVYLKKIKQKLNICGMTFYFAFHVFSWLVNFLRNHVFPPLSDYASATA